MREKLPGEIIAMHEKKELDQYSPDELRKFKSILSKHISKTNDFVVKSKGKRAIQYIEGLTMAGKRDYKEQAVVEYDSLSMSRKALALSVVALVISSMGTLWVILDHVMVKP